MPGEDLVSSLERAAHATPASIPVSSGLETTPLPAVLSSIGVVPLESAVVASVTVSDVPGLPASPQDDLDVPLSKLVPSCAEDKIAGFSSKASKLLASDNFAVDACSSSAHVGEAPPPAREDWRRGGFPQWSADAFPTIYYIFAGFERAFGSRTTSPVVKRGELSVD